MKKLFLFSLLFTQISIAENGYSEKNLPIHSQSYRYDETIKDANDNVLERIQKTYHGEFSVIEKECHNGDKIACHLVGEKYINKNNIQQGIDLLDKNCMIGFSMSCNVLADYYLEKQQDKAKFIYYSRHFYNQHCQRYNNADNSCTFAKEFEKL